MRRHPTTSLSAAAAAAIAALLFPLACESAGTETDNPMGPEGVEIRRSSQPYLTDVDVPTEDAAALSETERAFAAQLYVDVAGRAAADENVFLGPYGILRVLAMTLVGARGDTASEIETAMQLMLSSDALHPAMNALAQALRAGTADSAVTYEALDSLWLANDLETEAPFLDLLSQQYDTGVYLVDFDNDAEGARTRINSWVADTTNGLIPELFDAGSFNGNTELVLTDAAYLSAPWQDHFDPERTTTEEFALLDGNVVQVPMMHRSHQYPCVFAVDWRALELPFRDSSMGMVLVLPNPGEFAEFESTFDGERITEIVTALEPSRDNPQTVFASVPRFDFSSSFDLVPSLEALGMVTAFDATDADFSGIDPDGDLFVKLFVHQATVAVDEAGTIASAATGAVIVTRAAAPALLFNRPFVFFIYDHDTNTVLFVGRFVRPEGEAGSPETPPDDRTDAEIICDALDHSSCGTRTTTIDECVAALASDDALVLESCADCMQAAYDTEWSESLGPGDPCDPDTCADYCPDHEY